MPKNKSRKKNAANTETDANAPTDPNSNGAAEVIDPDAEKKKAERKEARAAQVAAQSTVAHSFKRLAELVMGHLTAGNILFGAKDGSETEKDMVFEIINAGDAALAVGFPKLDQPKVARGASVEDLKAQRSEVTRRFIAHEISEDEWSTLVYQIESKVRRLQAAEKKKAEAANAPPAEETESASAGA